MLSSSLNKTLPAFVSGEKGLFISSIPQIQRDAGVLFYKASDAVNKKKIIQNAFRNGDYFFNSGDLFYLDKNYFVYFADRIGDTFRLVLILL